MTIGGMADILKKASEFICRIGEGDTKMTDEEMHMIGDIMAIMHRFIANTEIEE